MSLRFESKSNSTSSPTVFRGWEVATFAPEVSRARYVPDGRLLPSTDAFERFARRSHRTRMVLSPPSPELESPLPELARVSGATADGPVSDDSETRPHAAVAATSTTPTANNIKSLRLLISIYLFPCNGRSRIPPAHPVMTTRSSLPEQKRRRLMPYLEYRGLGPIPGPEEIHR
jgi:hypothetical protein